MLYTPVLARSKLAALNLGALSLLNAGASFSPHGSSGNDMVRLNSSIALQLNHLKLELVPKSKSFALELRSLALHFLTDSYEQEPSDVLQGRLSPNSTMKCSTSQQELTRRGYVPILALTDFSTVFQAKQMAVRLNQVSLSLAEDSLQNFVAFLRLVQVSVSDDLVRLEDQLFDQSLSDSQALSTGEASMLVTYQGQPLRKDLSVIREQSMAREESVLLSSSDQQHLRLGSSAPDKSVGESQTREILLDSQAADESVLFGEEHPFQKVRDGDDMFTVSARPRPSTSNPFAKKPQKVNLLELVDSEYFEQPAETQVKADLQRYRKIHILSEEMQKMVCSLAFSFELGSVRVTLFCGNDFDFTDRFHPQRNSGGSSAAQQAPQAR